MSGFISPPADAEDSVRLINRRMAGVERRKTLTPSSAAVAQPGDVSVSMLPQKPGWLPFDGGEYNREAYARLWELGNPDAGGFLGSGNGTTTFTVPDATRSLLVQADPEDAGMALPGSVGGVIPASFVNISDAELIDLPYASGFNGTGTAPQLQYAVLENGQVFITGGANGSFTTGTTITVSSGSIPADLRPPHTIRGGAAFSSATGGYMYVTESGTVGFAQSSGATRTWAHGTLIYWPDSADNPPTGQQAPAFSALTVYYHLKY